MTEMPMPSGQIETLSEIETAWHKAERESDKRALWRALAQGGWLRACRDAVRKDDRATLEAWLTTDDIAKQAILQFHGAAAAQMVHTHLLCGLAACQARELAPRERLKALPEVASPAASLGFCHDLMRELLGEPPRQAERDLSLTVLLVDTVRNEGVVATLTLELIPDGSRELYPVPALAFLRDVDFRRAEANARGCLAETGLWQKGWDVRWQLQRRDGKPLFNLTGPSLGAAFALGIGKLCAQ